MAFKALVKDGRLVLDEPTNLPEGSVLDLVVDDEGDDLEDAEREALHASIVAGLEDAKAGRVITSSEALARLKARSG